MTIIRGLIFTLIANLIMTNIVYASDKAKEINELLNFYINKHKPGIGAVIAVVEGNNTSIYTKGVVNSSSNQALSEEHIFEIGSVSKTITGLLLANMVNSGEVELTDSINQYLPDNGKVNTENGQDITLLELATHSSGLPRVPNNLKNSMKMGPFSTYTKGDLYQFLRQYKKDDRLENKSLYSNLGFGLLGHVLSLAANKSYEQLVTERIFQPLDMVSSHITPNESQVLLQATPHGSDLIPTTRWKMPVFEAAGAINSNLHDMRRYLIANMNALKKGSPLGKDLHFAQQVRTNFGENGKQIGLSWIVNTENNTTYHWHNGSTGGFRSFIGFNHMKDIGIVILTNSRIAMDELGHALLRGQLSELTKTKLPIVDISELEVSKLTGKYQLSPNAILDVTNKKNQLFIQITDQKNLPVYPTSETRFSYDVLNAEIEFFMDQKSKVTSLTLFQNGQKMKAEKI